MSSVWGASMTSCVLYSFAIAVGVVGGFWSRGSSGILIAHAAMTLVGADTCVVVLGDYGRIQFGPLVLGALVGGCVSGLLATWYARGPSDGHQSSGRHFIPPPSDGFDGSRGPRVSPSDSFGGTGRGAESNTRGKQA